MRGEGIRNNKAKHKYGNVNTMTMAMTIAHDAATTLTNSKSQEYQLDPTGYASWIGSRLLLVLLPARQRCFVINEGVGSQGLLLFL